MHFRYLIFFSKKNMDSGYKESEKKKKKSRIQGGSKFGWDYLRGGLTISFIGEEQWELKIIINENKFCL